MVTESRVVKNDENWCQDWCLKNARERKNHKIKTQNRLLNFKKFENVLTVFINIQILHRLFEVFKIC